MRAELLKILPSILWFLLATAVAFALLPTLRGMLERGGISKVSVGILQLEFIQEQLRNVKGFKVNGGGMRTIPEPERKRLAKKFERLAEQLHGATILWVDDLNPQQNASLRHVLQSHGVLIDTARSTEEAQKWLEQASYDVIITDLHRPGDPAAPCYSSDGPANAGCALLKAIGPDFVDSPLPQILVYIADVRPDLGMPPYAKGMTNRPDQLLDLILNAVEQRTTALGE